MHFPMSKAPGYGVNLGRGARCDRLGVKFQVSRHESENRGDVG